MEQRRKHENLLHEATREKNGNARIRILLNTEHYKTQITAKKDPAVETPPPKSQQRLLNKRFNRPNRPFSHQF